MKTVLQDKITLRFFAGDGRWVNDIEQAIGFDHSIAAQEYCGKEGLRNVQILIHIPGGDNVVLQCDCWKR